MFSQTKVYALPNKSEIFSFFVFGIISLAIFVFAGIANAATLNVDGFTGDDATGLPYKTIQAAVDAANSGDTINVYPGVYNEGNLSRDIYTGAPGGSASGLLVYKQGLTIQGVDVSGNPVTNRTGVVATVIATQRDESLGDTIITGDDVTISGLRFQLAAMISPACNKNVFSTGENFTLKNSVVDNLTLGCSGLYLSDERGGMHVNTFTVQDNQFLMGEITVTNGVGQTGSALSRKIIGNSIEHITDWGGVSLMGITGSGWTTQPIGEVTVTGNTFTDNAYQIIARGSDYANPAGYWSGFLAGNTFDKAVLTLTPEGDARMNSYERLGWVNVPTDPLKNVYFRTIGTDIKEGITRATTGDTINVGAGTYNESVLVNKSVTIVGAGATKPVVTGLAPDNYIIKVDGMSAGATIDNLEVNGGGTTRGANGFDYGVLVNNSGTSGTPVELKNLVVKNVWKTSGNGIEVDASAIGGSYSIIHDSIVSSFDKRGIRFMNSSGKVFTSEVIGDNVDGTSRVQNLVNLWGGSDVEIYGNKLHNALTTGSTPTWDSPAIFISSYGGLGDSTANVHNNEIYSSDTGIVITSSYAPTDNSTATVEGNYFHNLNSGINFEQETGSATVHNNKFEVVNKAIGTDSLGNLPLVDAVNNWWGTVSSTTIASLVYGGVNYFPWYINSGKTVLSDAFVGDTITATTGNFNPQEVLDGSVSLPDGASELVLSDSSVLDFLASANTAVGGNIVIDGSSVSLASFTLGDASVVNLSTPQTIGGQSITVDMAVKLSSGSSAEPIIITNSSMSNVSVSIPDDTTILAPSGWTGTMQPPKTGSSSGTAPSGFTVGGTVISVGSPDVVLLFDKPVTVTLTGVTGTVGYKPAGSSTWTTIGTTCTGTYENPTGATFPGECKITNGTDTKILTYHFTTFGGLDPIPPTPTPTPAPVGGGGPIGLFGVVNVSNQGTQNAQAVVAQTPAVTNAATPTPRGQVLGVSTFRFTKPLAVGSRGEEVTELQNRLIAEGLLSSEATGYYGSLTAQAVKAFQAKYGIGQVGIVGPQTREKLNAETLVEVTVPGCESGNKFNTTTGEVCKTPSAGSQFGAAVSAFARTLSQGSTGDEVKSLQERLTKEGVYTGPITGYFGSLTKAAVEAYQEMKGLEKAGVVGPKTRAELNK
jgi:peptidoglycan hydrolase-like protein with peptidoglycan-binding domain